jgi:hypothetical protein
MKRFTRLALGFSKKLECLEWAVTLHLAYCNFCWQPRTLEDRMTPAMAAGLTNHDCPPCYNAGMASVLLKTFVVAGMIAWTRFGWRYRLLVFLVFVFPTGGAQKNDAPREIPHKLTADSSERTVRRDVPLGTPLDDARKTMEKKGFKCRAYTSEDGSNWIDCRIWERRGFLVARVRRVWIETRNGAVSGIKFREYLDGP